MTDRIANPQRGARCVGTGRGSASVLNRTETGKCSGTSASLASGRCTQQSESTASGPENLHQPGVSQKARGSSEGSRPGVPRPPRIISPSHNRHVVCGRLEKLMQYNATQYQKAWSRYTDHPGVTGWADAARPAAVGCSILDGRM